MLCQVPEDKEVYNVALPFWIKAYLIVHYLITLFLFLKIKTTKAVRAFIDIGFSLSHLAVPIIQAPSMFISLLELLIKVSQFDPRLQLLPNTSSI
jgi:hypothetical protein